MTKLYYIGLDVHEESMGYEISPLSGCTVPT